MDSILNAAQPAINAGLISDPRDRVVMPNTMPPQTSWEIDPRRGQMRGDVSSQWFSRPDDQKYLSLSDMHKDALEQYQRSTATNLQARDMRLLASFDAGDTSLLVDYGAKQPAAPTHYSFGQLASLVGAPAGYLRGLKAPIAALALQDNLVTRRDLEQVKVYETELDDGTHQLRAATGPSYGRIPDHEVIAAVRKIAGDGNGDTRWKVPGMIDWAGGFGIAGRYNPDVPVTKQTTTLYRSDRDVFLFLVDDRNPIEVGKLASGAPDLMFRGFYAWNSEVGSATMGIATMYLRGVCQNRCLWGVEQFQQVKIRHSVRAPERFAHEVAPALLTYSEASPAALIRGVADAKSAKVASDDDEALAFLTGKAGQSKPMAKRILESVTREEGAPARSIWDMVQGMTAVARELPHADARVDLERVAGGLLNKVSNLN